MRKIKNRKQFWLGQIFIKICLHKITKVHGGKIRKKTHNADNLKCIQTKDNAQD